MMPSRGLQRAQRYAPQLMRSQTRNLSSSPPQTNPRVRKLTASTALRPCVPSRRVILPIAAAIRHASTTSSQAPAQSVAAASPNASAEATAFPNLDTITLDNINLDSSLDISNIPEGIGYLSQIGINYGYGPTSIVQWILEHLHIYGGLPWWAAIAGTAMVIRIVSFPLYLKSSDSSARQNALISVTKPIMDRLQLAQKEGRSQDAMMAFQQYNAVRKNAGIKMSDQLLPPIIQGVFGYCGFKLMNAMSALPVPGLKDGGFLWLSDLTMTDGYLLMPLLMAGSIHMLMRLGGENGSQAPMPPGIKNVMLWGMPGFLFLIIAFQPGALCVWFAGSGIIGIVQALLFRNANFRSFFRLAPLYQPTPEEGQAGFMGMMMNSASKEAMSKRQTQSAATNPEFAEVASFARSIYQAPNLATRESRTIDTTLVNSAGSTRNGDGEQASQRMREQEIPASPSSSSTVEKDSMVQAGSPNTDKGVFARASAAWKRQKTRIVEKAEEQARERESGAFKRRADEYEKQAQRRKR